MTRWVDVAALAGIVVVCVGLYVWRRPRRKLEQSIKLTDKRHAEFLDGERH